MNLKIVLAAVVLMSGGSYASHAQKLAPVSKTVTTAKTFESKVAAYQKETNAMKSTSLLDGIKTEIMNGMASAKADVNKDMAGGNKEAAEKNMKTYQARFKSYNELVKAGADKAKVVTILKQYAQTL
jgi:hypothetical protein